jgi:hypothetical protein
MQGYFLFHPLASITVAAFVKASAWVRGRVNMAKQFEHQRTRLIEVIVICSLTTHNPGTGEPEAWHGRLSHKKTVLRPRLLQSPDSKGLIYS